MRTTFILAIALIISFSCSNNKSWKLESPDGGLIVNLSLSSEGNFSYAMDLNQNGSMVPAIESSKLGLTREDADFSTALKFIELEESAYNEEYELITGKNKKISYKSNQAVFKFKNADGDEMHITFRIFNDGAGFRYYFPGETEGPLVISKDHTSFNLPDEGTCWSQPYDQITKWTPAYETFYVRNMPIGTSAPSDMNGWSFPTTFHTNDIWVMITESNLDGTYPASHIDAHCDNGIYTIRFPEPEEASGMGSRNPSSKLPWNTPWRVIIAGPTPAAIIESNLVTNLADPSKIDDPTWIKPGRSAWSWWSDSPSPQFVKEQNRFTDLAVAMGWEYNLIDANWDQMKDGHVTDAIDYAVERNIGPILWYNSGGSHNVVEEAPRDRMWDSEIRQKEFQKISEWGVKGVKVDFFQSDKQIIINQYLGILKDAADNKVHVNFHGCTLPRGWNRTWPNMVTLESVRGGEVYKFGEKYPENAPWHNTVLPFTRNAVGPMDYTPVMFSDHAYPHLTTYAHELATSVVFESGIIHMADKAEAYLSLPAQAKQFLSDVPSTWDETRFIDGYPGDFIILARRTGNIWYVAGLNGNNESLELTLKTDFLDSGNYLVKLIKDGDTDQTFNFSENTISAGDALKIVTIPFGGFAGTIHVE